MAWHTQIQHALSQSGLNISGVADGRAYEHLLPGCRSVVVFGSGGTALWDAFVADLRSDPTHLTAHRHPLDDFVHRQLKQADPNPPPSRRWIRCAAEPEAFVDFRPLAERAGLGWRSRMGLLLHPTYGLWMGMRAACFTTEVLPLSTPLSGDGPCDGCPGHCATACPGDAFPTGTLSIRRCASFNVRSSTCHGRCVSRQACPEGATHQYGALQHHYHYARSTGRPQLAALVGLPDPAHTDTAASSATGPRWGDWAAPDSSDDAR